MNNEKIGVLVKTSLVDFPKTVACALFLKGCNFRCDYCYNVDVVNNNITDVNDTVTLQELDTFLEKRKNVLKGIVISGGEPTINPDLLNQIIDIAKNYGYKIKLDTNGSNPYVLYELLDNNRVDYVAMDIKTEFSQYNNLMIANRKISLLDLKHSVSILKLSLKPTQYEFRTVLYPPYVNIDSIGNIAKQLPEDSHWYLANFVNKECLNKDACKILPYTIEETNAILNKAKIFVRNAELR